MKISNFKFQILTKIWPILIYGILVVILFVQNYVSGTYLTGWDNLHPEFDLPLNIGRSLTAVWQEYQGVGLLGGHAHASDIFRQLGLFFLSFVLPNNILRYVSTFTMLFIGAAGAYVFLRYALFKGKGQRMLPFVGGLFYLLNLATIQTFYAPFEAFIAHFASLPWLLVATLMYFERVSLRRLLFFIGVLLLSATAAYIPTLFVVYLIATTIMLATFALMYRTREMVGKSLRVLGVILVVNAFWLLPFFYFTLNNASINLNSKINQMVTESIFLQNKEFGHLFDVIQLRGFWFNNVDPDITGQPTYMFAPWREYMAHPVVATLGIFFFVLVIIGLLHAIRTRRKLYVVYIVLFFFCLTALTIATPPFSWLNTLIRDHLPLLNQAFRFPFTKFSIITSLVYSIFFVLGLKVISLFFTKRFGNMIHDARFKTILHNSFFIIPALLLLVYVAPAFSGHLFYNKERLVIPQEYFDLFAYFKTQDPSARIANFPQHTFWGWNTYDWGYGGSGFLWYGIKQPILDRAFDVWSDTSENYYFEIADALYNQDQKRFEAVLNKYQITWLLVDKHVTYQPSPRALFFQELEDLIAQTPSIQKKRSFGKLTVYKVSLKDQGKSFVTIADELPSVNLYKWNSRDQAYLDNGNYISSASSQKQLANSQYYPFRSLFTLKNQQDNQVAMRETRDAIELTSTIPPSADSTRLEIPSFNEMESVIPATIITEKTPQDTLTISVIMKTPEIQINGKKVWGTSATRPIFIASTKATQNSKPSYEINVNGAYTVAVPEKNQTVKQTFLTLRQNNVFALTNATTNETVQTVIEPQTIINTLQLSGTVLFLSPKQLKGTMIVKYPKIADGYLSMIAPLSEAEVVNQCNAFRHGDSTTSMVTINGKETLVLTATNAISCASFFSGTIPHDIGYAIFVRATNEEGRGLHFWVENIAKQYSMLATYLPENGANSISTFVLPPDSIPGKAYAFHFDNESIGNETTTNNLEAVSVYPIPYNFVSALRVTSNNQIQATGDTVAPERVIHPHEAKYIVTLNAQNRPQTLILSQSYHPGWKAYEIANSKRPIANSLKTSLPFLFGKELKNHVKVNNWENGWILDQSQPSTLNSQLVLLYLPQYFQYAGWGLLGILLTVASIYAWQRRKT